MRYRVSPQVYARTVDGEAIILDGHGDTYLGLNKVGTIIWETVSQGGSAHDAATALTMQFEVSHDVAIADVEKFLLELTQSGVLQISDT